MKKYMKAAAALMLTLVNDVDSDGYYWSVSCSNSSNAYSMYFSGSYLNPRYRNYRHYGRSVRLVRDAR